MCAFVFVFLNLNMWYFLFLPKWKINAFLVYADSFLMFKMIGFGQPFVLSQLFLFITQKLLLMFLSLKKKRIIKKYGGEKPEKINSSISIIYASLHLCNSLYISFIILQETVSSVWLTHFQRFFYNMQSEPLYRRRSPHCGVISLWNYWRDRDTLWAVSAVASCT